MMILKSFAATLLLGTSALAQQAPSQTALTVAIGEKLDAILEEKKLAGAVTLVAKDGEIIHHEAYGYADLEGKKPVQTDTIFRVHSMTKAVTTAAALMLFEEGKYALDDPVANWIDAFGESDALKKITVESLMLHTSGLSYNIPGAAWAGSLEALVDHAAEMELTFEANDGWIYGISTDVLGRLVETWSGKSLGEFFEERLFAPLGMEDTGFTLPMEKRERFAKLYSDKGAGLVESGGRFQMTYTEPIALCSGGGGLVSTAQDYFQFLQMILDGGERSGKRYLKKETVAMMTTNRLPEGVKNIAFGQQERIGVGFGLGFNVVFEESEQWDTDAVKGEFGWGGAASCHYWAHPGENIAVITLEQTLPYNWNLERALKGLIYEHLLETSS
ncbi:MAG: serine hydrolase domain-containing protein [Verrucomicrobiota bacterium]